MTVAKKKKKRYCSLMERMGKKGKPRDDEMTKIRELMDMVESLARIPQRRREWRIKRLEKYFIYFLKG